jgi:hypothetical protein
MKKRIRIVRQPWTNNLTDTFEARVYELYLNQEYPNVEISYLGGDFSLSYSIEQEESRNAMLLGKLTDDPLNFLKLQPYISMVHGMEITDRQSKIRGHFSAELLFKSETFKREFSSLLIGMQSIESRNYLERINVKSVHLSSISMLLGSIEESRFPDSPRSEYLFIDVSKGLLQELVKKLTLNETYVEISTQIPEMLGEIEKNARVDALVSSLKSTQMVVTSNSVFAHAAYSLGKEVIYVGKSISSELVAISEKELIDKLDGLRLSDISYSMPRERVEELQSPLVDFIEKVLNSSDSVRLSGESEAYKDQVIAEIANSLIEDLLFCKFKIDSLSSEVVKKSAEVEHLEKVQSVILSSTSWKVTSPLRKLNTLLSMFRRA